MLQFVGVGDDPRSCRFSQMMEQRLEKVFSEAQAKVLSANSRLSVQVLWSGWGRGGGLCVLHLELCRRCQCCQGRY